MLDGDLVPGRASRVTGFLILFFFQAVGLADGRCLTRLVRYNPQRDQAGLAQFNTFRSIGH